MQLTRIFLENFKAHEKLELPLKKFTILIGPNSSGKSTILQSILILKRTLSRPEYNQVNLMMKTDSVDLGEFKDIATFGDVEKSFSIHLVGGKSLKHGVRDDNKAWSTFGYKIGYDRLGLNEVYLAGHIDDDFEFGFNWKRNQNANGYARSPEYPSLKLQEASLQGFHPHLRMSENTELSRKFDDIFGSGTYTKQLLEDFHYVPFFRVATKYGELLTRSTEDFLLNEPEHLIRFLMSNLSKDPKLLDAVSKLMEQLIGKSIQARPLDLSQTLADQGITMDFIKKGFRNAITNEGTGPNQALLLLSVLAGTKKGSVIAIDEPEIHLHPKGQTRLAKIMIELGKTQDKQIIFATHSEHMLYPFLASIASKQENSLTPSDVAIYYVNLDEKTNLSTVEYLEIDNNGQIRGGLKDFWEDDFQVFSEAVGESHE